VTLGRGGQILVAVVDHAHRALGLAGQQGGMEGDHRGVLLLAPEAAAGLRLDHPRRSIVQPQPPLEGHVDVVGALHRTVDGHPAVRLGDGDHGLVLDVELLLVADPIGPLEDQVGRLEAGGQVALRQLVVGEDMLRLQGVEDGLEGFGA
jgi:hypothetical protein